MGCHWIHHHLTSGIRRGWNPGRTPECVSLKQKAKRQMAKKILVHWKGPQIKNDPPAQESGTGSWPCESGQQQSSPVPEQAKVWKGPRVEMDKVWPHTLEENLGWGRGYLLWQLRTQMDFCSIDTLPGNKNTAKKKRGTASRITNPGFGNSLRLLERFV